MPRDYGSLSLGFVPQRPVVRWTGYGSSVDQITGSGWISQAVPAP